MITAGLTLGVLMSLAVAYFIGKQVQMRAYRRALERARESQLGPVVMLSPPREIIPAKALSVEQLAEMCIAKQGASNLIRLTERAIERQKIVQEVHPWREAAND